ncbi:MAG: transmembrane sensor/regulator PpyR [Pseudomonas sp.]|uniref:transmembrane sensor/regulator PpyR n=1 Tax=Pseudomonas sp. TaxID=306 RepID=UPI0030F1ADB8
MFAYLSSPKNVLHISNQLLIGGLALLIVGVFIAYGYEGSLNLPTLVAAHAGVILGPTAIKIGYVMRLIAHYNMSKSAGSAAYIGV